MTIGARFMGFRKIRKGPWLVTGALALAVLGVGMWLPEIAVQHAAAVVASRTGLQMRARDASIRWSGITFDGVSVGGPAEGLEAKIRALRVEASLWSIAFRGAKAVTSVTAEHVKVVVDASGPAYLRLRDRRARGRQRPGGKTSDGHRPKLSASDINLTVRDRSGELLHLDAATLRVAGAVLALGEATIVVGGPSDVAAKLEQTSIKVSHSGEHGVAIDACEVGNADVRLAQDRESPIHSARLRERLRRVLGTTPAGEPDEPAVTDGLDAPLSGGVVGVEPDAGTPVDARSAKGARAEAPLAVPSYLSLDPFARLGPGAKCTVRRATVRSVGADGDSVLLQDLTARLERTRAERLEIQISGRGALDGRLDADLVISRAPLRVDGNVHVAALPLSLVAPLLPAIPWHDADSSRIDAKLTVATRSVSEIAAQGSVRLYAIAIASPRVAPAPVLLDELVLSGAGRFLTLQRRLEIEQASASSGLAQAHLSGAVEWAPDHYLINLDVDVPRAPCDDVIKSAPAALLGDMVNARWSGRLSAGMRLRLDSRDLDATELELDVSDGCEFVTVPAMADLRRFRMPFVHSVVEPGGEDFEMQTGPGTLQWTYIEDISPFFVHAVLAHEDAQFFNHKGFSPFHIRNALVRNLREGRYVVGASTITMQLVKNVFLHREKTLARKVQEALLTWWIERVMDKRDILELYLNVIEYGPAVYGIKHAAGYYFKRLPSDLSPAEAVFLSTILPAPKRYHSFYDKGGLSSGWAQRMRGMFRRMKSRGWYTEDAADYGMAEVDRFRFVKEGETAAPRVVPGTTAPLPYQQTGITGSAWDLLFNPNPKAAPPQ